MLHLKPERVGTGREREKKKIIVLTVLTRLKIENSETKKREKKFKKLKSTIQVSFQAKMGWDRL